MATAGVQSSSSPRLPSPPPLTEVQIESPTPSVGGDSSGQDTEQSLGYIRDDNNDDSGATRRVRQGSKAIDMAAGPPLIPLAQLDSPFQLQEHLKALHNHYTRPEGSDTVIPIHRDIAIQLAEPPEGVDRALWLYELCRFLIMKVNNLIVAFFAENPPCSAQTCPEMQASEWQYLCAVHDPPKTCCAIDYCCHTLDWATNILTSPKHFPSRLTLGSEASGGPQASMRHLINIFRRVYRIFAHAWFKHREVFWQVEGNEGLYIFFKTVCDVYHLMPEDSYTVPAEAEGIEPQQPVDKPAEKPVEGLRVTILRKEDEGSKDGDAGATARRHKHSPSTGSRVATIAESVEDNEDKAETPDVKKDVAAPEKKIEEPGEETTIALVQTQEVTEQPNGDGTVVHEQEITEEPKSEEPETSEPVKESQPQVTEEQAEPSQPDETQTEPETSKPEESESVPATEESSEEPSEPAPEPAAEPVSKPETEDKKEQSKEQDNEPEPKPEIEAKSETEPAKET